MRRLILLLFSFPALFPDLRASDAAKENPPPFCCPVSAVFDGYVRIDRICRYPDKTVLHMSLLETGIYCASLGSTFLKTNQQTVEIVSFSGLPACESGERRNDAGVFTWTFRPITGKVGSMDVYEEGPPAEVPWSWRGVSLAHCGFK